ncbi:MAG: integrase [Richelia sp. RM1_1_1]|nr:integrase [Richelia sp. SM1_7_0]NJN11826.1 integrase [Richelia sp. RM1_1_1]
MDIDNRLAQANGRLRASNTGISIEKRGGSLWLRGTLPPKPNLGKTKPYQQKLSLRTKENPQGVKATIAGLQYAEQQARAIRVQLDRGQFDWAEWQLSQLPKPETVSDWVEKFETEYWRRRSRNQQTETTWKKDYQVVFPKFAEFADDAELSIDLIIEFASFSEPDTRSRKRVCDILGRLAKFAKLENLDAIKELTGSYSPGTVSPRSLPTDEQIAQWRDKITSPGWQWIYGMCAAYGLRPHEAFHVDMLDFPTARVSDETKTGERFIYPLYPEWSQNWNLKEIVLPNLKSIEDSSNAKLGTKVSGFFYDSKIPFPPYNLRHCYARRCFEFGFTPDFGAKLMGHSVTTHCKTYRAWIDEATYLKVYETLIHRRGRPPAPS